MLSPCHLKGSIIVFFLPTGIYRSMAADLNSGYTSAKANSQGEIKIQRINGVVKSFAFQYFTYCFILHPTGYRSIKWFSSKIRCLILKIDVKVTRPQSDMFGENIQLNILMAKMVDLWGQMSWPGMWDKTVTNMLTFYDITTSHSLTRNSKLVTYDKNSWELRQIQYGITNSGELGRFLKIFSNR